MKEIEVIIRLFKLDDICETLTEIGVVGIAASGVKDLGRRKGHMGTYHGAKYAIDLLPKVRVELVLTDDKADQAVDAILETARSGKIGDGKIFIYLAEEAIHIRTSERSDVTF